MDRKRAAAMRPVHPAGRVLRKLPPVQSRRRFLSNSLHEMANSGNADGISSRFPNGEDESSKTFFLNLSPEDFGVPADGYMILSLDSDGFAPGYGSFWEDTQEVSADGMLFFADIPMMRVGSHVTVTIRCYAADGTLISSGYSSGTVKVDGIPLTIGVIGSPEISVENGTANGNMAVQGGVQYEVLEYTDAAAVSMTAVNGNEGSTMVVQVNGTTVATTTASSMSAPLSDGFNAIVATVSKGNNEPIEMKRNVYVVKALNDGLQTIAVTLTKPYCTPIEITKTIYAKIKPVTVWADGGDDGNTYYYGDRGTSGRDSEIKGDLYVGKNNGNWAHAKNFDSDFDNYDWVGFWNNGNINFVLEEKTDTFCMYTSGMKWDGSGNGDGSGSCTLSDIAASKRGSASYYDFVTTTSNWKIAIHLQSSD